MAQEYIYLVVDQCNSYYVKSRILKCKRRILRRRVVVALVFLSVIIGGVACYFSKIVNPIIMSYGEQHVSRIMSLSCNDAISQVSEHVLYDKLITIGYNSDGSISYIKANTENINKVSNLLAHSTQVNLDVYSKLGYSIPIGTLSGIGFLSGKGSNVTFAVNPIGSVICKFNSSFTQAGINQTSHKILVTIGSEVSLVFPFQSKVLVRSTEFLISECIIVGKIPSTYLNISKLEDLS